MKQLILSHWLLKVSWDYMAILWTCEKVDAAYGWLQSRQTNRENGQEYMY